MPLYDYRCNSCGQETSRLVKLINFDDPQACDCCNHTLTRVIGAPKVVCDYEVYQCPVTGKPIEGRKAHRENLKRTGSRLLESGEKEQFIANKKRQEEKEDAAVDETVERALAVMPSAKKERLFNEVLSGADTAVVRQ